MAERLRHIIARLRVGNAKVGLDPVAEVLWIVMLVPRDRDGLKRRDAIGERAKEARSVLVAQEAADDVKRRAAFERSPHTRAS